MVPNVTLKEEITYNNKAMLINDDDKSFKQDTFEHEQAMVIKKQDKYYLFSGCSHKGIINIANSIKEIFNINKIDFLIGGLHLVDDTAYNYLKKQLGNKIQYLRTGSEIDI